MMQLDSSTLCLPPSVSNAQSLRNSSFVLYAQSLKDSSFVLYAFAITNGIIYLLHNIFVQEH